jgi:HEAT repeat protein
MSTTPSVSKWKFSTYILAATTALAVYQGHRAKAADADPASIEPATRDASYDKRMSSLARLRIPAGLAGVDERQLLRDLEASGSVQKMTLICERLGIFGTDISVEPLARLSKERPTIASAAILAMGGIGSDAATDRLIGMINGNGRNHQYYVVKALAKTKNPRAEMQIIEWAQSGERYRRLAAIEALGTVGGDEALSLLQGLAQSDDSDVVRRVLSAAGVMGTSDAVAILQEVADRGNRHLRVAAIRQMPSSLDEAQEEWLMNVLAQPDPDSAAAAASALGRAHVADALPLLLDAARTGSPTLRNGAVSALAMIGGEEAEKAIIELFESAGQQTAYDMGRALLSVGDTGRAAFLATMKRGHRVRPQLIYLLSELSGDDVDAIRMDIARNGQPMEKQGVFSQLAGNDDDEVIDLMLDMAKNGPQQQRGGTLGLLAQSSSPRARTAIVEIARGNGPSALDALRILGDSATQSPEGTGVLIDALYSKNQSKMQAASWALASAGSEEGRAALVSAMQSDDIRLARLATDAAGQLGGMTEVTETLHDLANNAKDPQVKASALRQLVSSGSDEAGRFVVEAINKGEADADYLISSVLMSNSADSDQVVAAAAKSDKPSTRAALAGALAMRGGDEASMKLLDSLSRDDDDSVKSSAIYAMSSIGSRESIDRLVEIASNGDKSTRQIALSVIGNTGDPRATQLIANAISSDDNQVVQSAIYSSQSAGPEVDTALLALAENDDAEMHLRQQAVTTLVNRGADVDDDTLAALRTTTGADDMPGEHYFGH